MSNIAIGPGAKVLLPVFVEGALLTIEDVHAAMGDGESASSAVEMGAEVTLRCDVSTGLQVDRPVVVTRDAVMTTGEGDTMEAASHMAVERDGAPTDVQAGPGSHRCGHAGQRRRRCPLLLCRWSSLPCQSGGLTRVAGAVAAVATGQGRLPCRRHPGVLAWELGRHDMPRARPPAIGAKCPRHHACFP